MTGVARIQKVNIPSIARGGQKVTLVLVFENVGDQTDSFWWSVTEYEDSDYTREYGGGTQIFNRRIEGYYAVNQVGTAQKILVMPTKTMRKFRVYAGHYTDAAKTVQETDDWKDIEIARSEMQGRQEKTWSDGVY